MKISALATCMAAASFPSSFQNTIWDSHCLHWNCLLFCLVGDFCNFCKIPFQMGKLFQSYHVTKVTFTPCYAGLWRETHGWADKPTQCHRVAQAYELRPKGQQSQEYNILPSLMSPGFPKKQVQGLRSGHRLLLLVWGNFAWLYIRQCEHTVPWASHIAQWTPSVNPSEGKSAKGRLSPAKRVEHMRNWCVLLNIQEWTGDEWNTDGLQQIRS